ncbi:MAG: methylated-DNA--[protein]-cysteine S-methyltransferase [Clostridia bacterium]|nr:methylated-DNA--[protein]-cysteine S-methyltransferase [Clostridia bacterium]NLF20783.1 methylated-DNA--[protein]-cysteine S-methyltransferase [Clostridiaceae bacterium]
MTEYYLREFRLADSRTLSNWLESSVPPAARTGKQHRVTLVGMRNYLRQLLVSPLFEALVWELVDEEPPARPEGEEVPTLDLHIEAMGIVLVQQTALQNGTFQIEFVLNPEASAERLNLPTLLDLLLRRTGADARVKAVSLHVPERYDALAAACSELPFKIPDERYPMGLSADGGAEEWMRLYTLSKTSNWPYTWVFVPAPAGIIAAYGNEREVSSVKWLAYNSFIEDVRMRELCIADGLADRFGKLKSREACENREAQPVDRQIPAALLTAQQEIREYIAGQRQDFDVPLALNGGTRFQRLVWQRITDIPYGSTVSYEDVGIAVAGGDKQRGRNLTRAVGAACGANPLVVLIPCHRVIAKDGKLQGYAYGVERKDWLLSLEVLNLVD